MEYEALEIHIAKDPDGAYRLRVTRPRSLNTMDTPLEVEIPVEDPAFMAPIHYLSGLVARPDDTKLLGEKIRKILFPGIVWEHFKKMREAIKVNQGLRVRIQLDKHAPQLGIIPWEYCYSQEWNEFFAVRPQLPIVRYIGVDYDPPDLGSRRPRLLLAMASPEADGLAALDEAGEAEKIAVLRERLAGQIEVEFVPQATFEAVKEQLLTPDQAQRYDIFHFLGHGLLNGGRGALAFENVDGGLREIDHEPLKYTLQAAGVKLVVLTACQTAAHGEGDIFKGVAQSLVQAGIPAVVAMQFPLEYKIAQLFIEEFYSRLSNGYPLDTALGYGRLRAYEEESQRISWGIPVLFMQSEDGRLWLRENAEETVELVEAKTVGYQELQQENADESKVDDRLRDALLSLNFTPQLNMLEDFRRAQRAGAFLISVAPEIMAEVEDVGLEFGTHWLLNRLLYMVEMKTQRQVRKLKFSATSLGAKPRLFWAELARSLAMPNHFSQPPEKVAARLAGQLQTHHVALTFSNARLVHLNTVREKVWPVLAQAVAQSDPGKGRPVTTLLAFLIDAANQLETADIAPIRRLPPVKAFEGSELKSWYEHSLALLPPSLQMLDQGYEAILLEDDGASNQGIPDLVLLRIAELTNCWDIIEAIKE